MDYNMPHRITNEKDLDIYESFLNNERDTANKSKEMKSTPLKSAQAASQKSEGLNGLRECLKRHIGKLIKAEILIGDGSEVRTGVLIEVGADFIVIKQFTCCTAIIDLPSVKLITVSHDNNRNRLK